MINLRCFTILYLCSLFLFSCNKSANEDEDYSSGEEPKTVVSLVSTYSATNSQNQIDKISVYSFAQKWGESAYTFEKKIENIQPHTSDGGLEVLFTLDGTLPRIFYAVANGNDKIIYPNLTTQTTSLQFEQDTYIVNQDAPESPYILIAKNTLPTPKIDNTLSVEFAQTTACLDINNKYAGFVVDSLVLKNTMNGAHLFENELTEVPESHRVDINYKNATELYIYPADRMFLAVYGKYNNIKTVFDIPLTDIKAGTRYRVTFRGINDQSFDFSANLIWNVEKWSVGNSVDSNPDWLND